MKIKQSSETTLNKLLPTAKFKLLGGAYKNNNPRHRNRNHTNLCGSFTIIIAI